MLQYLYTAAAVSDSSEHLAKELQAHDECVDYVQRFLEFSPLLRLCHLLLQSQVY